MHKTYLLVSRNLLDAVLKFRTQTSNLYHYMLVLYLLKRCPSIAASKTVAELLGCSIEDLNLALSKRHMKVNNENIVQKLTLAQVGFSQLMR